MPHAFTALLQGGTPQPRPPEWAGWLSLAGLLAIQGLIAWWLLASPVRGGSELATPSAHVLRMRYRMALVVLVSFVLLRVGASWDELWHRLYGLPFGEDLLWPPHLLMYASFVLQAAMVAFGLSVALQGRGALRTRFRREPLLAMLGLLAGFGFAFIPVDIVWHQVIGPDLTAASPPHVVGAVSGGAVALVGVALVVSTSARPVWRRLADRPGHVDAVALGVLAMLALNWLQLLTTEWDWANKIAYERPAWVYPLIVGVIGAVFSHLALHVTQRIGAATCVALVNLALHAAAVIAFRVYLPPGPTIAAHVVLVPAAAALDIWYAAAIRHGSRQTRPFGLELGGAVVYAAALLIILVPYAAWFMSVPVFDPSSVLVSVVVTTPAIVLASLASARLGSWLASLGRAPLSAARTAPSEEVDARTRAMSPELAAR
jgi:uncharacterized membrane protein YdcZ (DUF606 family)